MRHCQLPRNKRSSETVLHPTSPLSGDAGPVFHARRFQLWCGIPKASGKHSLQHSHSGGHSMTLFLSSTLLLNWGFFLPMLLSGGGLGSCPMVPGSFCEEDKKKEEEEETSQPPSLLSTTAQQLCSLSKTPPPSPNHWIFSVAENPSHERFSSTEVIKHG